MRYRFHLQTDGSPANASNAWLELADANGLRLRNDAAGHSLDLLSSTAEFVFTAPSSGSYYLDARQAGLPPTSRQSAVRGYDIGFNPIVADDHADDRTQASPLLLDSVATAVLDGRYDEDWFHIDLAAGQR